MPSHRGVAGCFGLAVERVEDERDLEAAIEVAVDALDHGGGLGQIDQEGGRRAAERRGDRNQLSDAQRAPAFFVVCQRGVGIAPPLLLSR
jgi:hypothetical protein